MDEGMVAPNNPVQPVATPVTATTPKVSVVSQQSVVAPTQVGQVPTSTMPQSVPAVVPSATQQFTQPAQPQTVQAPISVPAQPAVSPVVEQAKVSETTVQTPMPVVKPAIHGVAVPPVKKLKKKKNIRSSTIFLFILGILVLAILGVFIGLELYQGLQPVEEQTTEAIGEKGKETSDSTESPVKTMTAEELRALVDTEAIKDSLREIEDAAVDIDATNSIIDENLEKTDDPPDL